MFLFIVSMAELKNCYSCVLGGLLYATVGFDYYIQHSLGMCFTVPLSPHKYGAVLPPPVVYSIALGYKVETQLFPLLLRGFTALRSVP